MAGAYKQARVCHQLVSKPCIYMVRIGVAWCCAIFSLLTLAAFVNHFGGLLQAWELRWAAFTGICLTFTRAALGGYLSRLHHQGRLTTNIAIIGHGLPAQELALRLRDVHGGEVRVIGTFFDALGAPSGTAIDDLFAIMKHIHVDEIIIAVPWRSVVSLNATIRRLADFPIDVKFDPWTSGLEICPYKEIALDQLPMLNLQKRPLKGWNATLKRVEDVVIASILLAVLALPGLIIMLLIKLDSPGPVFFRQERFGFNNDRFMVFKFRTMRHEFETEAMIVQARYNDPRITRFGGFLRRTSIDEFPQLINVLRGDMSLVGPRPHASSHNEQYGRLIDGYLARHRMRPGITGWAQVNGLRGETNTVDKMKRRLEHDLFYIENWSFFFDCKIIMLTVPAMITGANAW